MVLSRASSNAVDAGKGSASPFPARCVAPAGSGLIGGIIVTGASVTASAVPHS
jgi:hypothetical protein